MSINCAVCGRPGATRQTTVGGTFYGNACKSECLGLLWSAHFIKATGGSEFDHSFVLWEWRRRRAEVDGRTFLEPAPLDPRDAAGDRIAADMEARLTEGGL